MSIRLPRAAPAPPRPGLGDTGRAAAGRAGSFQLRKERVRLRFNNTSAVLLISSQLLSDRLGLMIPGRAICTGKLLLLT